MHGKGLFGVNKSDTNWV